MSDSHSRHLASTNLILGSLLTVWFGYWLVWSSSFGLDLSDESFRLNWIAYPWLYDTSISLFGFVYSPFFHLLHENLSYLRLLNFITIYSSIFLLSASILSHSKFFSHCGNTGYALKFVGISAVFSSGAFWFFHYFWITVPGYGSLSLISLAIACVGLLRIDSDAGYNNVGWGLLSFGGWLAFMAKPTTAAALLVIVVVYLTASRSCRLSGILTGAASLLLLATGTVYLIDGSLSEFISRMARGLEWARIMGGGHTFWDALRLESFSLSLMQVVQFGILLAIGVFLSLANGVKGHCLCWLYALISLAIIIASFVILLEWQSVGYGRNRYQVIPLTGLPIGLILGGIVVSIIFRIPLNWSAIPFTTVLVFLPYAHAFGSNVNYWVHFSSAGIFWIFAGLYFHLNVLRRPTDATSVIPQALIVQSAALLFINGAMADPYRQVQPLWENTELVKVGEPPTSLTLDKGYARYIRSLKRIVSEDDFTVGAPIIDKTGHSPGAIFALGGVPVGEPWLIGGYPGSEERARQALNRVPCEVIASSWVLSEINGPRELSGQTFQELGLNLQADYQVVGEVTAPMGHYDKHFRQVIMKPKKPTSVLSLCRTLKKVDGSN